MCELTAHPDFVKLLADIQIYVEGIAATQIQNLNTWVDVGRDEIMVKYQSTTRPLACCPIIFMVSGHINRYICYVIS